MKIDVSAFLKKSLDEIEVSLKSDENNGHFTWRCFHVFFDRAS